MSKLTKQLNEWKEQNLISDSQVNSIEHYESLKQTSSWIMTSLYILGAVIIGTGIVSVVAANWYEIPDSVKLFVDFSLLALISYVIYYFYSKKNEVGLEAALVFYQILCFASIGLVAQIYNTGGKAYQAMLIWSVLTALFILFSRKVFSPMIWAVVLFSAIVMYLTEGQHTIRNYPVAMILCTLLLFLFTLISYYESEESNITRGLRYVAIGFGLVSVCVIESSIHKFTYMVDTTAFTKEDYFIYALVVLIIGSIASSSSLNKIQKFLICVAVTIFGLSSNLNLIFQDLALEVSMAVATIVSFFCYSIYLVSAQHKKLFQFFVILIGIRFIVLYFQALGGLATTGFGLIVSGILMIGMAMAWNKNRTAIATWAERISQ